MRYRLAAGILLFIFFLASAIASRLTSPGWDEPAHIGAGVSYVQTGRIAANPQHPPLLKEFSGMALTLAGVRWPDTPEARSLLQGTPQLEWPVGTAIMNAFGVDRVLLWARLPMILVAVMLGIVIFVWGQQLFGYRAALAALFLYVCDPTIMAHSSLVTMDVGFAAFTLLFCFSLWKYLSAPSAQRMLLCGIALGLVVCTKFSSVVLLPAAGTLALIAWHTVRYEAAPMDVCPCGSGKRFKYCHSKRPRPLTVAGLLGILGVAFGTIELVYLFHPPSLYWTGLRLVNVDHDPTYQAVMAGNMAPRFPSYFLVVYLLKEPLAAIILAAFGVAILIRRRKTSLISRMCLLLPPVVIFVEHMLKADNIGIRYIIPVLPFAALFGGLTLDALFQASMAESAIGWILCGWTFVAAAGIYPDGLSYFNESACVLTEVSRIGLDGGSRCGTAWLDESNVDWGLGLRELKKWQDTNANGRTFRLMYFGSFPPESYGIGYEAIEYAEVLGPSPPRQGLYAVSAHHLARARALAKTNGLSTPWVQLTPPAAVVGHAFYIYDVP